MTNKKQELTQNTATELERGKSLLTLITTLNTEYERLAENENTFPNYGKVIRAVQGAGLGALGAYGSLDAKRGKQPLIMSYAKNNDEGVDIYTAKRPATTRTEGEKLAKFLTKQANKKGKLYDELTKEQQQHIDQVCPAVAVRPLGHHVIIDADTPEEVSWFRQWFEDVTGQALPPATVLTPGTALTSTRKDGKSHSEGGHWYFALPDDVPDELNNKQKRTIKNADGVGFDVKTGNSYALIPPFNRLDGNYEINLDFLDYIEALPEEDQARAVMVPDAFIDAVINSGKKKQQDKKNKRATSKKRRPGRPRKKTSQYSSVTDWKESVLWGDLHDKLSQNGITPTGTNAACGCPDFHYEGADSIKSGTLHNKGCEHAPEGDGAIVFSSTTATALGLDAEDMTTKANFITAVVYGGDFDAFLEGEDIRHQTSQESRAEKQQEDIEEALLDWKFVLSDLDGAFFKHKNDPILYKQHEAVKEVSRALPLSYNDVWIAKAVDRMVNKRIAPVHVGIRHGRAGQYNDKTAEIPLHTRFYIQLNHDNYARLDYTTGRYDILSTDEINDDIVMLTHGSLKPMTVTDYDEVMDDIQAAYNAIWHGINVPKTEERVLLLACMVANLAREHDRVPTPLVAIEADAGSGKTTTAENIAHLIDANAVISQQIPTAENDLTAKIANAEVLIWDNLTRLTEAQQDLFCSVSTGGVREVRELYTTAEVASISVKNFSIFTWKTDKRPRLRDDFMRRLVMIHPEQSIAYKTTMDEIELAEQVGKWLPQGRGFLYALTAEVYHRFFEGAAPTACAGISLKRFSRVMQAVEDILLDWGILAKPVDVCTYYVEEMGLLDMETVGDVAAYLSTSGRSYSGTATQVINNIKQDARRDGYDVDSFPRSGRGLTIALNEDAKLLETCYKIDITKQRGQNMYDLVWVGRDIDRDEPDLYLVDADTA